MRFDFETGRIGQGHLRRAHGAYVKWNFGPRKKAALGAAEEIRATRLLSWLTAVFRVPIGEHIQLNPGKPGLADGQLFQTVVMGRGQR